MHIKSGAIGLVLALVATPAGAAGTWRELTSQNFVLHTDLGRDEARAVLEELELLRALLLQAMFDRDVPSPEPLEAVVLADREEFVRVTGRAEWEAYFTENAAGRRRIVLAGGRGQTQGATVAHELTHYLSKRFVRYQPRWLSEGLAMYFQTLGEGKGNSRSAGTLPTNSNLGWLSLGPLPAAEVLAWRANAGDEEARYYATSWLLVHYLMNNELDAFGDYQRRLARGEVPRTAWNAAFPAYALDQPGGTKRLDKRLEKHLESKDWESLPVEAEVHVSPAERDLPASEVHALKLDLGEETVPSSRLRAEAEAALDGDPGHLRALAVLAELQPPRSVALARRAVAAHPDDPDAWLVVAAASRGPGSLPAREAALRRALALGPARMDVRVSLATTLLDAGRPEEAEAQAREGVRLAPWSPTPLGLLGRVLFALGRCDEAFLAMGRATDLAAETVRPADAAVVAKGLSEGEQRCRDDRLREADVLALRADLAKHRHDAGAAHDLLEEALRRDPKDLDTLSDLAWAERSLGHLDEAARLTGRFIALAPGGRGGRTWLAGVYREQGRFGLAEAALRDQLKRFPDDEWGRMDLVDLLLETSRPGEARRELKAFKGPAKPGSAVALARARLDVVTGADPQATAALEREVAADPQAAAEATAAAAFAEANVELDTAAQLAYRARRERTAIAADAPLDAIGPDHADAGAALLATWGIAGRIAARRGELAEAEGLLAAAERAGAGPEVSAFLAEALAAAGRQEEAVRAAARALAAGPGQRLALHLAGPTGAAGGREDLVALRSLAVPGAAALAPRDLFVALGKDGKVLRVVARDVAPLAPAVEALVGTAHGVALPPDAPPFLVVAATLRCSEAGCVAVLGRDPGPPAGGGRQAAAAP